MRYDPKLPEHNDNITHEKPGREFVTIIVGFAVVAAVLFLALGLLVDVVVDNMSLATETKFSEVVGFKQKPEKSFAPEKQATLQKVVDELSQCAHIPYKVSIQLTKNEQPNAIVFPGGNIVVFSGLLDTVKSENGLAFVLAHEFGHLKNRDHLRAMGRGLLIAGLSMLVTGSDSHLTQILMPVHVLSNASHSQQREMEADTSALQVLQCRYGHVGGATEFFEAMSKDKRLNDKGLSHYFDSHPQVQARIDNINQLITQQGLQRGTTVPLN